MTEPSTGIQIGRKRSLLLQANWREGEPEIFQDPETNHEPSWYQEAIITRKLTALGLSIPYTNRQETALIIKWPFEGSLVVTEPSNPYINRQEPARAVRLRRRAVRASSTPFKPRATQNSIRRKTPENAPEKKLFLKPDGHSFDPKTVTKVYLKTDTLPAKTDPRPVTIYLFIFETKRHITYWSLLTNTRSSKHTSLLEPSYRKLWFGGSIACIFSSEHGAIGTGK